jgi:hypothetical protein
MFYKNSLRKTMKKVLLVLALTAGIWATTGDISAPTINPDGMSIKLTVAGLDSGGTYANGWSLFKVPGANTGYIAVKRLGFDGTGAPTTLIDTVFLDTTLRKHYPNDAADSEVVSGGNTTITVALSSVVYLKDTIKYVKVASGWYTKTGVPNNAYAVTSATNNSTQAYPRVVGRWTSVDRQKISGATLNLKCAAYHISGRSSSPVRVVKFWAYDQHSDTATALVTAMTIDGAAGDAVPVQEYIGSLSTTALTQGDTVQCNFWAFPWYGDSAASLNTGDGVNAYQSGKYTKLVFVNDKAGTYGVTCACVDTVNGVNANGTAVDTGTYNSSTTPCFKDVGYAINAIKTYNNTNHSRNESGGSHVFLKTPFRFSVTAVTAQAPKTWITIEPNIGLAKYSVACVNQSGSKMTGMTHLKNITITSAATSVIDLENLLWVDNDSINASGLAPFYRFTDGYFTGNKIVNINAIPYSTSYGNVDLWRGNTFSLLSGTGPLTLRAECFVGNKSTVPAYPVLFSTWATGQTIPTQDDAVCSYNILTGNNSAFYTQGYGFSTTGNDSLIHGAAIVGNVFEKTAGASPVNQFGADHAINTFNNFLFWYNTSVGQRMNVGYNDHDAVVHNVTNISFKNNAIENRNVVPDNITHDGGPNGALCGNWQMLWGVNCEGNVYSSFALAPSFLGIITMDTSKSSTEGAVSFHWTTDASQNGAGTGNGNYFPLLTSNTLHRAANQLLPYDIIGAARHASGAAGAYEYPSFNLTMATTGGSGGATSPTIGVVAQDSNTAVAINQTAIPMGYRWWKWTRTATTPASPFKDSTQQSTYDTIRGSVTITAVDSIIHFHHTNANDGFGTYTPATGNHDTGAVFTLTASPAAGYRFWKWTRSNTNGIIADSTQPTTTMYLKGGCTVTLNDSIIHYVFTNVNDGHGTFTPTTGLKDTGTSFSIVATASQGYRFWKWARSGIQIVIADSSLSSTSAILNGAGTLTLNDTTVKYYLTMTNSSPAGTLVPSSENVDSGAVINLSFTAPSGYGFWKYTRSNTNVVFGAGANDSSHASATAYLKAAGTITVYDTAFGGVDTLYTLAGIGGSVSPLCAIVDSSNYLFYDTATAMGSYVFLKWTRNNTKAICADSTSRFGAWTMSGNDTVTANFLYVTPNYTVTIVNAAPGGTISPAAGTNSIDSGAVTSLSFTGPAGYRKWKITASNSAYVVFNADSSTFYPKNNVTLTWADTIIHWLATNAVTGSGIYTPATALHDSGAVFAIAATPAAHYAFTSWSVSGGAHVTSSTTASTTAWMTAAGTVTANFHSIQYTLTIAVSGPGTTTPPPGDVLLDTAIRQTIHGTPTSAWDTLAHWTGTTGVHFNPDSSACSLSASGTATCVFGMRAATTPTQISPAQGDTLKSKTKVFTWSAQATTDSAFILGLSTDSTTFTFDTVTTNSKSKTLSDSTKYFWKVKGGNPGGWSVYSTVLRFRTLAAASSGGGGRHGWGWWKWW